jgi:hypothetical protein
VTLCAQCPVKERSRLIANQTGAPQVTESPRRCDTVQNVETCGRAHPDLVIARQTGD